VTSPYPEEPTASGSAPHSGQQAPQVGPSPYYTPGAQTPPTPYPSAGYGYGQIQPYGQGGSYNQPPYPPQPYGQPGPLPYAVAPKSPVLALLVSFFIPGVGSMMNGEAGKGIGILIGYVVSWVLTFAIIGIPMLLGFWIWGMIDAYTGAQKWNFRHGIVS